MTATAATLCCSHPEERIDSPEPPSRPLANLDGIFAAAALPEDHPHALRFPERKPELHGGIIRSPGFASKIKLQFQRKKSRMSLGVTEGMDYDGDAKNLTSPEVLEGIKTPEEEDITDGDGRVRFGSVTPEGDDADLNGRSAIVRSSEFSKPTIQQ